MATQRIRIAGSWVIKDARYIRIAGAWVSKPTYVRVAGAWVLIAEALAATVSPTSVSGTNTTATVQTNLTTVIPAGGSGVYTYAWSVVSYTGVLPSFTAATSASTRVRATDAAATWTSSGVVRCTVSDGVSSVTKDVSYSLERTL